MYVRAWIGIHRWPHQDRYQPVESDAGDPEPNDDEPPGVVWPVAAAPGPPADEAEERCTPQRDDRDETMDD